MPDSPETQAVLDRLERITQRVARGDLQRVRGRVAT